MPGTHTYRLTSQGTRLAMFLTKLYARVITPSLADLDPALSDDLAASRPLARAWRSFETALDQAVARSGIAA
jgi:hypothetical protein